MKNQYYIYILSGTSDVLQLGVTKNPEETLREEIECLEHSFLDPDLISKMVYLEAWDDRYIASIREAQLKAYKRKDIIKLIEDKNPDWDNVLKLSA